MATKTKTTKIDYTPRDASLGVDLPANLPSRHKVESYLADVESYERKLADVYDRRETLCAQGMATVLGVLLETADELTAELDALGLERHRLLIAKTDLCAEVASEVADLVTAAEQALNDAIRGERARLAAIGVDAQSIDVYRHNPAAGERIFEAKVRDCDSALAARAVLNKLTGQYAGAVACGESHPGEPEALEWPWLSGNPELERVAKIAGLERQPRQRFQFAVSEV